jgi:pilus assembly protein TadC
MISTSYGMVGAIAFMLDQVRGMSRIAHTNAAGMPMPSVMKYVTASARRSAAMRRPT